MKTNFSLAKILDNDKLVRIFAVLIAIIAWFIVSLTVNTEAEITIYDVPVVFNLTGSTPESYGLDVIEGEVQTVDIKIEGVNYVIGNLKAIDFIAVPTLTQVTKPGDYELKIDVQKVDTKNEDYSVTSAKKTVKARFDYVREVTMNLTATAENITAQEGYVKEAVLPSPNKITLKGPQSELDKISKCVVEAESTQVASDILVLDGNLVFYSHDNVKVKQPENVTHQQQKFEVTVQIYKHKTVPFAVNFVNVPLGLDKKHLDYTLSDLDIEISGPKETIDNIDTITLGDIDFRKVNIGSTFELDVNLPAGVVNVNNTNLVTVLVNSNNLDTVTLTVANINTKNIPAAYDVEIMTKTINKVKIVGSTFDISTLTANELVANVDFQAVDLSDGNSRVPVSIYALGNKFVWAVGEYTVLVNATKKE